MQKTCEIGPDETLGDVYFKKLFPMGVDAMMESLDLVKAGIVLKHDQRLDDGSYESWFRRDEAAIDWARPVADVLQCHPRRQPGTRCLDHTGRRRSTDLRCRARGRRWDARRDCPKIGEDGVVVQGEGGRILIKRVRPKGGDKQSANEWAASTGLKPGAKLG